MPHQPNKHLVILQNITITNMSFGNMLKVIILQYKTISLEDGILISNTRNSHIIVVLLIDMHCIKDIKNITCILYQLSDIEFDTSTYKTRQVSCMLPVHFIIPCIMQMFISRFALTSWSIIAFQRCHI